MIETPTHDQRLAANPHISAWVGANAGSGKTRVLTQRVARLLLEGAEPAKILCLTYTKAAAAEMQTRLFAMLGGWSMLPDAVLAESLGALEGRPPITDPGQLRMARRLFARALETPGGLKIQTIHAFCDALLRRFPLEAGVSPGFDVLDERRAALILSDILSSLARAAEAGEDPAFDLIAKRLNEGGIDDVVAAILPRRDRLESFGLQERLDAFFGAAARQDTAEIAASQLGKLGWTDLHRFAEVLRTVGGKIDQPLAEALRNDTDQPEDRAWTLIHAVLKDDATARRATSRLPTKAVKQADPGAVARTEDLMDWAEETAGQLRAVGAVSRARDLHLFGDALLSRYKDVKTRSALLDFEDLIDRARDLLTRSELGAWALYKLDQGIDHVLVDEAQDTSPAQWSVIEAVTGDFFAGQTARERVGRAPRSIFVVGDEKQSIYSFQGAEPKAFSATRSRYLDRLEGVGGRLEEPGLVTSFRSASGVLAFVDRVFEGDRASGLTVGGEAIRHEAHREADGARIDLWPLIEPLPAPAPSPWYEPVDATPPDHPKTRLAAMLAAEIARMIAEDRLPARTGKPARPVRPGDILVLVRKRDALAQRLIRNLKSRGVPVAGADRLSLAAELAVKDVVALIKAILTPADDLSLAAVLRSPLCSISEDALFDLAHGRESSLWRALMTSDQHPREVEMLRDLAGKAGFQGPYAFLETVLTRHDGRRRLLARLGPEVEDPIDELLAEALKYEAQETPTLAGFVAWIDAADISIKREMESGADQVRVMTIHGAKGLEAPVVILPDTVSSAGQGGNRQNLMTVEERDAGTLTLWPGSKANDDPVTARARREADQRTRDEQQRLLYVGLTRAEDWLILAGAGRPADAEKGWYSQLASAMAGLDPLPIERDGFTIQRLETGLQSDEVAITTRPAGHALPAKPPWLTRAAREARPERLSPSALVKEPPSGGAGQGREAALVYGRAVHLLLERLPGFEPATIAAAADRLLATEHPDLPQEAAEMAISEAISVLTDPHLSHVFSEHSLGEVAVRIDLAEISEQTILGRIDRLIVREASVQVVDLKTDAQVPQNPSDVPASYLAQMAAYADAIARIYPGRSVTAAILWTRNRSLMPLPPDLLQSSLLSAIAARGLI